MRTVEKNFPHWFNDIREVVLPENLEYLMPDENFVFILTDINIQKLINLLVCGNRDVLQQPGLFKIGFCEKKTINIIELWKSGTKLLPPSILVNEDNTGSILCDGRYRMNVAMCYGQTSIPIVVSCNEKEDILRLLAK